MDTIKKWIHTSKSDSKITLLVEVLLAISILKMSIYYMKLPIITKKSHLNSIH